MKRSKGIRQPKSRLAPGRRAGIGFIARADSLAGRTLPSSHGVQAAESPSAESVAAAPRKSGATAPVRSAEQGRKAGKPTQVQKLLADKSREELLSLVVELAGRFPEVERRLLESEQLLTGRIEPLARALRQEIRRLSEEQPWFDRVSHQGSLPDYSHVEEQFRVLLNRGHCDLLLELGEELLQRGTAQVEQADDEGQTGRAIRGCLEVVLQAVTGSSLARPQQLLWVLDRMLADEYELLATGEAVLVAPVYTREDWQEVAGVLEERLGAREELRCSLFVETYQRKKVMKRLLEAYQRAGWGERILPLLEKEADQCRNYEQLVEALLSGGNLQEARQWSIRGFEKTRENLPAMAAELLRKLREIAALEKRFDLVASYRAQDFFNRPCLETYRELRKSAEKAGVWEAVRSAAFTYLESGERPDGVAKAKRTALWPLPEPEVSWSKGTQRRSANRFPDRATLIEVNILEKDFDRVATEYRALEKSGRLSEPVRLLVAKAVAASHPALSLEIWRGMVDNLISQARPRAYAEAVGYLRLMHKVYENSRQPEQWQSLLAELRRSHRGKPRLVEMLNTLGNATDPDGTP